MNMAGSEWLPYTLSFKRPWQTSRGGLSQRQGRLHCLRDERGATGWGDSAPLPEFGISPEAADAFAEETARLDLAAQAASSPLHRWLGSTATVRTLGTNGTLGALASIAPEHLRNAIDTGYTILKIKVGAHPVDRELTALRQLATQLPRGITLRLDANRAWSLNDARRFITGCHGLPVEGLEEPLAQPDLPTLTDLQSMAAFALGIDESTHLIGDALFQTAGVRRLIIKPARQGGLQNSLAIARQATAAGIECIVTAALESRCGLLACAHLAAVIAPDAVHGLGTSEWFTDDLGTPPSPIEHGLFVLPTENGLGFAPGFRRPGA